MVVGLAVVLLFGLILPVAQAPGASACSCIPIDAERVVGQSAAAFVGIATEVFDGTDASGAQRLAASFEVIEAIKGDFGDTVVLFVKSEEDSCGAPRFLPDSRDTYFGRPASVTVWGGFDAAEECIDLSPDFLPQGPRELPAPVPGAKAEVVWVGEWMGTGLRLLGRDGAFIAYAEPAGIVGRSAVMCADQTSLAYVATVEGVDRLVWRDLQTMQILSERLLASAGNGAAFLDSCSSNHRVLAAVQGQAWSSHILDQDGLDLTLNESSFQASVSEDGLVAAAEMRDGSISVTGIDSGEQLRVVGKEILSPGELYGMALSPDGRDLAVITHDGKPHLTVIDSTGAASLKIDLPGTNAGNGIWWLDAETVAVATTDLHLVNVDGQSSSQWPIDQVAGDVVSFAGTRVLTRQAGSQTYVVTDLTDASAFEVEIPDNAPGFMQVLPSQIATQGDGYMPPPGLPLPGVMLPTKVEELLAVTEAPVDTADNRAFVAIFAGLVGAIVLALGRGRFRTRHSTSGGDDQHRNSTG